MVVKIKNIIFSILLTVFCLQISAYADMGAIVPYNVKINEDAQRAIILHNEKEEVLILGTDLHGENETKILRFIPLPSEPEVSQVNADVFKVALALMKKYKVVFVHMYKGPGAATSAVEIRLNKSIGAHDVTVIKVNNSIHFRSWVNQFFKKKGLPQREKYPFVEQIVNNYVKRGIKYFVFDLVNVTKKTASVAPLAYRFRSDKIYYPLITSNSFGGGNKLKLIGTQSMHGVKTKLFYKSDSEIGLIFIAPKTLFKPASHYNINFFDLPKNYKFLDLPKPVNGAKGYWSVSTSAYLPKKEIEALYPKSNEFFKHNEYLIMQFIRYRGFYNFNKDVYNNFSGTSFPITYHETHFHVRPKKRDNIVK